jgi:two-component system, NarL family, nitrate/nitrite response regulator NarL
MVEAPKKISILLASDFSILSDSLISIFKSTKDLKLIGCVNTAEDLTLQISKFRPNVLLLDISISTDKFSSLMTQISEGEAKILVINQDLSLTQTIEALRYGAHGVIGRKTPPELLCRCVRAVASGDIWVGRGVTTELVQFLRGRNTNQYTGPLKGIDSENQVSTGSAGSPESRFGLTKREMQIVNALVEAQTNKDIAETFGISEYTVKHHLTNIFDKLGVYNRVELALFAINHQLCPSGAGHAFSVEPGPPTVLASNGKSK